MTEGCPERFDLEFFRYVLFWKLGPGPRTEAHLKGHEKKMIRLQGPTSLKKWIETL
jgi:hypothetical protein